MSDNQPADSSRRFWLKATCVAGGAAGVATAVPFVSTFQPSERAKAAGAPVEVDIGDIRPGEKKVAEWRGKPVWILRRTPEMLASLKETDAKVLDPNSEEYYALATPDYAKNEIRARKDHQEYLVVVGICSHLGCSPSDKLAAGAQPSLPDDWSGGFLCPCHGSTFDLAGRVYQNKPANRNLDVPPYMFLTDTRIIIGKDEKGEA